MEEYDDTDFFEPESEIINLTKATDATYLNLDPYTLSLYNISVLKKCIKIGYNVNKQNSNGITLLLVKLPWPRPGSCARKNPSKSVLNTVKYLLEYKADRLAKELVFWILP